MAIVFMNGAFVPLDEARISVRTNALHYGTGLFEGTCGYWNAERRELYVFRLGELRLARVVRGEAPLTSTGARRSTGRPEAGQRRSTFSSRRPARKWRWRW